MTSVVVWQRQRAVHRRARALGVTPLDGAEDHPVLR